jgi:hypothetical protein
MMRGMGENKPPEPSSLGEGRSIATYAEEDVKNGDMDI